MKSFVLGRTTSTTDYYNKKLLGKRSRVRGGTNQERIDYMKVTDENDLSSSSSSSSMLTTKDSINDEDEGIVVQKMMMNASMNVSLNAQHQRVRCERVEQTASVNAE